MGRSCPDLEANLFFDPDEIEAAYLLRDKVPPAKPRLNDVLRQIACLGGFLARKGDGEPGVKTIWLGLKGCSRGGKNDACPTQIRRETDLCATRCASRVLLS